MAMRAAAMLGLVKDFSPSKTTDDYSRNRRLFSRKWIVGAGTVGGLFFCAIFVDQVTTAQCASIVAAAAAYIFGEAYVDSRKDRKDKPVGEMRTLQDELEELNQLRNVSLVSDEDYEFRKGRLLASWSLPANEG